MKICIFCHKVNGIGEITCQRCQRPLDRAVFEQETNAQEEEKDVLQGQLEQMDWQVAALKVQEQQRSRYDDIINNLAKKPEFQQMWMREMMQPS
jgi:hypothetical protein